MDDDRNYTEYVVKFDFNGEDQSVDASTYFYFPGEDNQYSFKETFDFNNYDEFEVKLNDFVEKASFWWKDGESSIES